jgi:hypothetical protein
MQGIVPRRVTIVALLAFLAFVSGCGGGGGTNVTSDSGDASLTKAQFVKKGDQICRRNYTKREQVLLGYLVKAQEAGAPPPQAKQEEVLITRILPIFREESEELDKLGLPTTETKKAEAILQALESAIAAVESEPAAALREGTGVQFAQAEKLARSFGFAYCGRS